MQSLYIFLLYLSFIAKSRGLHSDVSVLLAFGDSTVDSGNNNFIPTIARSNLPPYGQDFPGKVPTGRFTNGKLITDFIASYLEIKQLVPPYLDPTLTIDDLKTGVCFASAGSGFDPLTSKVLGVIPMEKQLEYLKEYKERMESSIGKPETDILIKKTVVIISAGSNDFIENYFFLPIRNKTYSISEYQNFLLQQEQQFIEGILDLGIRNILVAGLPPFGCAPVVMKLESGTLFGRHKCLEWMLTAARDYNSLLQAKLSTFQNETTNVMHVDIYSPFDDIIKRPQFYGFDVVDLGCCGTGTIETSVLCNSITPLCSDASKYVFWDSVHPTQAAYYKIFLSLIPAINRFLSKFVQ